MTAQLAVVPSTAPMPPGLKILLMGSYGVGKTHSILTLLQAGLEVFVIFTEPGGLNTIMQAAVDFKIDTSKFHYRYIAPAAPSFATIIDNARKVNTLSQSALQKMEGLNRNEYSQFIDFVTQFNNFVDQNGEQFGDVSKWDSSRAIVVDSMSGLNTMALDLVAGGSPMKSMAQWGMAMDNLSRIIMKICGDTNAHFLLTGHIEPERDETTGRIDLMLSTLGKKLAPTLPRVFDEVIFAYLEGDKFLWSTAEGNIQTKARLMPRQKGITPSFVPLIDKWRKLYSVSPAGG
jgi:hypothetical protein